MVRSFVDMLSLELEEKILKDFNTLIVTIFLFNLITFFSRLFLGFSKCAMGAIRPTKLLLINMARKLKRFVSVCSLYQKSAYKMESTS